MPGSQSSGTQAATINTEHTLLDTTTTNVYVLVVDTNAMTSTDTLELRIYVMAKGSGTLREAYYVAYTGAQTSDAAGGPVKISVPVPTLHEFKATLKQTAGTGRSYDWEVIYL